MVLAVQKKDGRIVKRPLAVSSEDIMSLLDEFFKQPHETTGLTEFDLGLWQGHYNEWRKITKGPECLLDIFSTLSEQDLKFLQKHMMD